MNSAARGGGTRRGRSVDSGMSYGGAASMEKAGFLVRLVAWIIDIVILAIVQAVLNFILVAVLGDAGTAIAGVLNFIISIAYFVYFWSSTGATPGHQVMGLRVVGTDGTFPITIGKAIVRYVGYVISIAVIFIGLLWVIWDGQKQGWHDKIAGTYVVRSR
jgi:uncharacterized RDD family membrane protein YckC